MTLTDRQRAVLRALGESSWSTALDVGGARGTHHSKTLRQLVDKGLAEVRSRDESTNSRGRHTQESRQSAMYRRTVAGSEAMRTVAPGSFRVFTRAS